MAASVAPSGREPESQAKALLAARAAFDKHAERVVVMDLRGLSSVTDFFVVCTALSSRQISAIAESVEAALAREGCAVAHTEGAGSGRSNPTGGADAPQWVLMDCGDVVVHLFDEPARAFYRLEELWADAPRLPVSDGDTAVSSHPEASGPTPASASPPRPR